jgi:conjugal transfer pilus assembly protein TraW
VRYALLPVAALICAPAIARDYGQQGTVYPVIEADLLQAIRTRLGQLEASGETARLNQELKRRTISRVNRPEPVAGMGLAEKMRVWRFDPTITIERDIVDDKKRVILTAGTRVNPLDTVPLRTPLLFLNGDNPAEIAWATGRFKPHSAKLILVRGAALELMRQKQRRFYFDQGGKLIAHFGIRATPATVEQDGRALRVTEWPLPQPRPKEPSS